MKILMTGSQGFIGSLLRKRFAQTPWTVVEFQGDILELEDLKKYFFEGCQWDFVIHLAAIGNVPECEANPARAYEVNAVGAFMIADAIGKYCPRAQLIFSSTGQVYDLSGDLREPIGESHPVGPGNAYAKTKRAAELYIQDCFNGFSGSYVILRIFNHSHKTQSPDFFMPTVYQQIIKKKDANNAVELEVGNMDVERDIGAVQDLVEAFYKIISGNKRGQEVYNLCSGVGKSLRRVVQEMASALGLEVSLKVIPERVRQGDPLRMIGSSEKFCLDYGWSPRHAPNEKELVRSFLSDGTAGDL